MGNSHLRPDDELDEQTRHQVHPLNWVNPTPTGIYNLVVIGAGTAGLVSAGGAGGLGARVALIEQNLLGGDCLNVGCVPSKALLAAAKQVHALRRGAFGLAPSAGAVDFRAVMQQVRASRAKLAPHDSAERFQREFGVDVYFGAARFTGPDTVEVGGQTLRFRRAILATGSRPTVPAIPGLAEAGFLTNESVFNLNELPERLVILGGGPIGCELAQAFAALGSQVTMLVRGEQLLPNEEPEASRRLLDALRAAGVTVRLTTEAERVDPTPGGGGATVQVRAGEAVAGTHILVAAGRKPNVADLGLTEAGVTSDPDRGVLVSEQLRTTNPWIYAVGDVVAGGRKFTHAAEAMARLALRNALFLGRGRHTTLTIPWCTYTTPEVAHVGLTRAEAEKDGVRVTAYELDFDKLDRAVTEGTSGWVQVLVAAGTDRIVGATVVGPNAGELIGTLSVLMTHNLGLKRLADTVLPYPTYTEAIKKLADQFNRTRLTPTVKTLFGAWLKWRR